MEVEDMKSDDDFASHMENDFRKSLVVVLYFLKESTASNQIQPIFRKMSLKFNSSHIKFITVDADVCRKTIQKHNIKVMPTFVLYRNMEPIQVIQGAKPLDLEEVIRQELKNTAEVVGDVGFSMGPGGAGDLYHFIDPTRSECLNASDLTPFASFLERKNRLESDCDEQLILVYGFNQPVKIKSLKMKAPVENGPKCLKLFINQVASMDFSDVNQYKPTQEIFLKAEDLSGESCLEVNQARFQNVTNLHIFIPENMSNIDLTQVTWLTIYGDPVSPTKGITGKTEQVIFLD